MAFAVPSHLPRKADKADISTSILTSASEATPKTLSARQAASWVHELESAIRQTKIQIHDRIYADLPAFERYLDSSKSVQARLHALSSNTDSIADALSHPDTGLVLRTLQTLGTHQTLATQAAEAHALSDAFEHLSTLRAHFTQLRELISAGHLLRATHEAKVLEALIADAPRSVATSELLADLKTKFRTSTNRLSEHLDATLSHALVLSSSQLVVRPVVPVPKSQSGITIDLPSIFIALGVLSPASLAAHLATLRRDITTHYLQFLSIQPAVVSLPDSATASTDPSRSMNKDVQEHKLDIHLSPPTTTTSGTNTEHELSQRLTNISAILSFLSAHLFPALPAPHVSAFTQSLARPLSNSLLKNLLEPALPSLPQANKSGSNYEKTDNCDLPLSAYLNVLTQAVQLEHNSVLLLQPRHPQHDQTPASSALLASQEGLTEHDHPIATWSTHIRTHYERRRRIALLEQARALVTAPEADFEVFRVDIVVRTQSQSGEMPLELQLDAGLGVGVGLGGERVVAVQGTSPVVGEYAAEVTGATALNGVRGVIELARQDSMKSDASQEIELEVDDDAWGFGDEPMSPPPAITTTTTNGHIHHVASAAVPVTKKEMADNAGVDGDGWGLDDNHEVSVTLVASEFATTSASAAKSTPTVLAPALSSVASSSASSLVDTDIETDDDAWGFDGGEDVGTSPTTAPTEDGSEGRPIHVSDSIESKLDFRQEQQPAPPVDHASASVPTHVAGPDETAPVDTIPESGVPKAPKTKGDTEASAAVTAEAEKLNEVEGDPWGDAWNAPTEPIVSTSAPAAEASASATTPAPEHTSLPAPPPISMDTKPATPIVIATPIPAPVKAAAPKRATRLERLANKSKAGSLKSVNSNAPSPIASPLPITPSSSYGSYGTRFEHGLSSPALVASPLMSTSTSIRGALNASPIPSPAPHVMDHAHARTATTNGALKAAPKPPPAPVRTAPLVLKESYAVSSRARGILELVRSTIKEAEDLARSGVFDAWATSVASSPSAFSSLPSVSSTSTSISLVSTTSGASSNVDTGVIIVQVASAILDLYRALYPIKFTDELAKGPGLSMRLANDAFYIFSELDSLESMEGYDVSDSKSLPEPIRTARAKLMDARDQIQAFADGWCEDNLRTQERAVDDLLAEADGFTNTGDQAVYDRCEEAVSKVVRLIRSVAHQWKAVVNKSRYYSSLGQLVDATLERVLADVLELDDITEDESNRLAELCRILNALEGLFVEDAGNDQPSFAVAYVPSWLKFSYLSVLLEASIADIQYLFDDGALVDFEVEELAKLVRALFAETPLRTNIIGRLLHGHPVRE